MKVISNRKSISGKKKCAIKIIQTGDKTVSPCNSAKNIGVIFDSALSMEDQINSVCKSCYLQLRHISQIRKYLSEDAAATLAR